MKNSSITDPLASNLPGEDDEKRRLQSGHVVALAELRQDYQTLAHLLAKYRCDQFHLQLRLVWKPKAARSYESLIQRRLRLYGQIQTTDILDVLWDEWDKGRKPNNPERHLPKAPDAQKKGLRTMAGNGKQPT